MHFSGFICSLDWAPNSRKRRGHGEKESKTQGTTQPKSAHIRSWPLASNRMAKNPSPT
jgi:hypothetical protein